MSARSVARTRPTSADSGAAKVLSTTRQATPSMPMRPTEKRHRWSLAAAASAGDGRGVACRQCPLLHVEPAVARTLERDLAAVDLNGVERSGARHQVESASTQRHPVERQRRFTVVDATHRQLLHLHRKLFDPRSQTTFLVTHAVGKRELDLAFWWRDLQRAAQVRPDALQLQVIDGHVAARRERVKAQLAFPAHQSAERRAQRHHVVALVVGQRRQLVQLHIERLGRGVEAAAAAPILQDHAAFVQHRLVDQDARQLAIPGTFGLRRTGKRLDETLPVELSIGVDVDVHRRFAQPHLVEDEGPLEQALEFEVDHQFIERQQRPVVGLAELHVGQLHRQPKRIEASASDRQPVRALVGHDLGRQPARERIEPHPREQQVGAQQPGYDQNRQAEGNSSKRTTRASLPTIGMVASLHAAAKRVDTAHKSAPSDAKGHGAAAVSTAAAIVRSRGSRATFRRGSTACLGRAGTGAS